MSDAHVVLTLTFSCKTHAGGRVAVRLWAAQLGFPNKDAQLWDCGGRFALQNGVSLGSPCIYTVERLANITAF